MNWRPVGYALALVAAFVLVRECAYRSGLHDAEAHAADRRTDTTVARLAAESFQQEATFKRAQDSTSRVIARLRARIIPRDRIRLTDTVQVAAQLDVRDSLIRDSTSAHVRDSLQIVFWRAQVIQYRDTLAPNLQRSRDACLKQSERRWFCVAGAGVAVGLNGRGAVGPSLTCGYRF